MNVISLQTGNAFTPVSNVVLSGTPFDFAAAGLSLSPVVMLSSLLEGLGYEEDVEELVEFPTSYVNPTVVTPSVLKSVIEAVGLEKTVSVLNRVPASAQQIAGHRRGVYLVEGRYLARAKLFTMPDSIADVLANYLTDIEAGAVDTPKTIKDVTQHLEREMETDLAPAYLTEDEVTDFLQEEAILTAVARSCDLKVLSSLAAAVSTKDRGLYHTLRQSLTDLTKSLTG